jgi:hypothetical protein
MVTRAAALPVDGLVERLLSDPISFVERVLVHVVGELAQQYEIAGDNAQPPDETLASALGSRLAGMIASAEESQPDDRSTSVDHSAEARKYDELVARSAELASALGACDCWGDDDACPICHGIGEPGWTLPERQLFASYIRPAARTIARAGSGRSTRTRRDVEGNYSENGSPSPRRRE